MLIPLLLFGLGIVVLYFGAEWLVRGASQLALGLGISPVVVGLTVVAMGTSAPELVASLQAQLVQDSGSIVLGNVIGSNIYNVGLILGLAAMIGPLTVHSDIVKRETPLAIGATILLLLMMLGGTLYRWEGAILLVLFAGYILLQIYLGKKHRQQVDTLATEMAAELQPTDVNKLGMIFLVLVGILGLVVGARLLIDNAVILAQALGISERVIGLTMVAFGTSLPELATTLVAAIKKERDIAVANVVGSNIFNILLIVGSVATIRPISNFDPVLLERDGPFMLVVIGLMMLMVLGKGTMGRIKGGLLFALVMAYGIYLFF
jgi:cation:H+ antiporter